MAGQLTPASGSVTVASRPGYLPQDLTLRRDLRVDEVLGVAAVRAALAAIEAGDAAAEYSAPSARTGTPRPGPKPPWTSWAWPTSHWTARLGGCLAVRRCCWRWPGS